MLRIEDNTLLTRVGRGTELGALLREYWHPVLISSELPTPDCAQLRIKVLGEDLIAFRDTAGRVGILDERCAHRRASLFYGRNEEGGIRCPYHGWKYDIDGRCLDMPNEPPRLPAPKNTPGPPMSRLSSAKRSSTWVFKIT